MLYFERWKVVLIFLVSLAGFLFALPNVLPKDVLEKMPSWLPHRQMPLGLDLQGGSHLLLQMNMEELIGNWLKTIEGDVRKELRGEGGGSSKPDRIAYTGIAVGNDQVRVTLKDAADLDKALKRLKGLAKPLGNAIFTGASHTDLDVTADGPASIVIKPNPAALQDRVSSALSASIETIRRRVDALGTTEPIIQREGASRIVVQVPGFNDPEQLKSVINKTARLTFQLVDQSMSAEEAMKTRPPAGTAVYQSAQPNEPPDLLRTDNVIGGEDLVDAQPGYDSRTNEPIVSFRLNAQGGRRFAQLTKDNVNRPFAIVLDNKVISAPVIREPILSGSGQISGNFTVQQANELAIQLRSGALPASLQIIQENSVGPSLGSDSIAAGKLAFIIGFLGIALFMVVSYGLFGIFANIALLVNVMLIVAALSMLQSTLTLPGIAGIVLTMGMAVDANVLIFERLREELRAGKSPALAIDAGFTRAYATILDSNVTHLIAGAIMFWFGSGPVRGFAVALVIGIATSLFTAVTVSRFIIIEWLKRNRKAAAIPI